MKVDAAISIGIVFRNRFLKDMDSPPHKVAIKIFKIFSLTFIITQYRKKYYKTFQNG